MCSCTSCTTQCTAAEKCLVDAMMLYYRSVASPTMENQHVRLVLSDPNSARDAVFSAWTAVRDERQPKPYIIIEGNRDNDYINLPYVIRNTKTNTILAKHYSNSEAEHQAKSLLERFPNG